MLIFLSMMDHMRFYLLVNAKCNYNVIFAKSHFYMFYKQI